MSRSTDRILAAIDAGLQDSDEPSYGEGDWPWARSKKPVCVRCHGELDDGDVCQACRLFLSGDSDHDPEIPNSGYARPRPARPRAGVLFVPADLGCPVDADIDELLGELIDRMTRPLNDVAHACTEISVAIVESFIPALEAVADAVRPLSPAPIVFEQIRIVDLRG